MNKEYSTIEKMVMNGELTDASLALDPKLNIVFPGYEIVDTVGCIGNKIITASGGYFDYADPRPEDVHIDDIVHALSKTCRFAGHCNRTYSVAEHSIRCMQLAEKLYPGNKELAFAALMHDAAESYLTDLPKPLKIMCPAYREVEARVEKAIQEKYGISTEYHDEVKRIDLMMLKAEKKVLFPDCEDDWGALADVEDCRFEEWSSISISSYFKLSFNYMQLELGRK